MNDLIIAPNGFGMERDYTANPNDRRVVSVIGTSRQRPVLAFGGKAIGGIADIAGVSCRATRSSLSSARPAAGRADDNVKSRRQARPCAPGTRYTSGRHGTTADNGTCNLRTRLRLSASPRVRFGVDGRRNQSGDHGDDE